MGSRIDGSTVVIDGVVYRYLAFDEAPELDLGSLTASENDVLAKVVKGWSNRQIGESRGTSARTIANQLRAIYQKLRVHSRHELIARVVAGD